MGIVNINDDSFSGDGSLDPTKARQMALDAIMAGADLIDIGAESARTNRSVISEEEEIRRLEPFLRDWPEILSLAGESGVKKPPLLSINTWRPGVARAVLALGGDLLNDMGGLPDPVNARICADFGCSLLIMHTVGLPKQDHSHIRYRDLWVEMLDFFEQKVAMAGSVGLDRHRLVLDPGLGFAKQPEDDLCVLARLSRLVDLGLPVLVPVSRKGFIGEVLGIPEPVDRDVGTMAACVAAMKRGAAILRVHNVKAACLARAALLAVNGWPCRASTDHTPGSNQKIPESA